MAPATSTPDAAADFDGVLVDVVARHRRGALGGGEKARQHAQGRALPGTVRTEKTDDLPFAHFKRHGIDGGASGISFREIPGFDHFGGKAMNTWTRLALQPCNWISPILRIPHPLRISIEVLNPQSGTGRFRLGIDAVNPDALDETEEEKDYNRESPPVTDER